MIGRAKLALGRPLGREGQGMVHEELSGRINGRPGVAYKEIDYDVRPGLDVAVLAAMTQLTGRLSSSDAAWLEERAAWPAELVEENGAVVGFLMRTVPQRFFRETPGPSGAVRRLATLDRLFGQEQEDVTDRDRLLILADLADTLARLHATGVVAGDLSPKNVLFTTEPRPGCFLIGCDAMGLGGARALPPVEPPSDRRIPAGERPGTPQGDAYQFALLVIRVFARDPSATDVSALAAVHPGLAEFATAALDQPPFGRPMPAQWAARLREAAQPEPVSPPARQAAAAPGSGRSKLLGIGAAVGAVVLVLLAVVAKNVIKNNVREALTGPSTVVTEPAETSSSPAPADSPTQAAPTSAPTVAPTVAPTSAPSEPVAAFKVGDCLSGLPDTPVVDRCEQGAPYRVAAVTTPSGLCDGTTNHRYLIHDDVLYCLAYQFGRNYCYKWSHNEAFVDFARKCRAPKTFTVRRVLRGNADKDATACDGVTRHSWTWPVPALTICVEKY
ncbi:hypothetical protein AB0J71_30300 [Nonomuraea sp. NPDC049637]|uniref:hypothetical protein n=1 Tax=Nonomuraea sp. NPDC049637 TaxID=3154356 RepID=UPI00343A44F6